MIISHIDPGETEDSFIADLAVATNAGQIKTGSFHGLTVFRNITSCFALKRNWIARDFMLGEQFYATNKKFAKFNQTHDSHFLDATLWVLIHYDCQWV